MHASIRDYEGIDATHINDVVERENGRLPPKLREHLGFAYYPIKGGNSRPPS
jgi:hypothetical protein